MSTSDLTSMPYRLNPMSPIVVYTKAQKENDTQNTLTMFSVLLFYIWSLIWKKLVLQLRAMYAEGIDETIFIVNYGMIKPLCWLVLYENLNKKTDRKITRAVNDRALVIQILLVLLFKQKGRITIDPATIAILRTNGWFGTVATAMSPTIIKLLTIGPNSAKTSSKLTIKLAWLNCKAAICEKLFKFFSRLIF